MLFKLTLLGTNSAIPAYGRFMTAQILQIQDELILIDCGEGAQIRMNELGIKKSKINQIFISHLHGDHIFGLIGLLTSYSLNGRSKPITIFAPPGLQEIIEVQIKHTGSYISYPLQFKVVDPTAHQLLFENQVFEVYSVPLDHRIPTSGYLFREKPRPRKMNKEAIKEYELSIEQIRLAKTGADIIRADGKSISNTELTIPAAPPRAYAFCSDTAYKEDIVPIIKGVDLLYHETTFLHEALEQAEMTKHSTAKQAAQIALLAEVGQLICGHYSSRYKDVSVFEEEARPIFPNTIAGRDGASYEVELRKTGN